MSLSSLSLLTKGTEGRLTKMVDQPCDYLQQSAVYMPQGSRTGWQLSLQDFTVDVIQGYGHLLSQDSVVDLGPACWIVIDAHTPYQVEAEEDLLLLVTTLVGVEDVKTDLNWLSLLKPKALVAA